MAVALIVAAGAAIADDVLLLKPATTLDPLASAKSPGPTHFEADRLTGKIDDHVEAEGDVVIHNQREHVEAEWLRYDQVQDELQARGDVSLLRGNYRLECTDLSLKLTDRLGAMNNVRYFMTPDKGPPGRGGADTLHFEGLDRYSLDDATYTTCPAGNEDWILRANRLELDYARNLGLARDVRLDYLGTPILYAPWLDFSLDNSRKSGFLTPSLGVSDDRGLEILVPWYWNIAPNRDATFTPRVMTRRGVQLISEFRYLEPSYQGGVGLEYLPDDRAAGETRHHAFLEHRHQFNPRLTGTVLLEEVSDDDYFADLSNVISQTTRVNLPREGTLNYDGGWWNGLARLQSFQTLLDPLDPSIAPLYQRLPQLLLNAARHNLLGRDLTFNFGSEFVHFDHDDADMPTGNRFYVYPSVTWSLESNFAFLRPKLGWHFTRYDLERNPDPTMPTLLRDATLTRSLPIFSLDSGLFLERDLLWKGRTYRQTLEPRLYYVNIPYRDQNDLPVFDSTQADLSLSQLFSENQFVGIDRINDANQVTLAITSRFLEPSSGLERLQVTLGQRYYFNDQQVSLPGFAPRGDNVTDLFAQVSGQVTNRLRVASGFQYNPDDSELARANLGATYRVGPGKQINADLRYINDLYAEGLNQLDLSWQWPIKDRWYSMGRLNYSFQDNRLVEGLLGFEYNAGCWTLRGVLQQLATTAEQSTQVFFLQLELNGLTRLGPNPLDVLKRSITGYTKSDELDNSP